MRTLIVLSLGLAGLAIGQTAHPAQVAGVYEGTVARKSTDGRKVTLILKQDGASEFRDGGKTTSGHWSATGKQLRVEMDGAGAGPAMVWKIKKTSVVLEDASKTEWGKKGLTLRRPR